MSRKLIELISTHLIILKRNIVIHLYLFRVCRSKQGGAHGNDNWRNYTGVIKGTQ